MGDETIVVRLSSLERNAILEALINERNMLIEHQRPADTLNEVIVKVARARKSKQRDCHEAR